MNSQVSPTFEILVDPNNRTIEVHSTEHLCSQPVSAAIIIASKKENANTGLGDLGREVIKALFVDGVTEMKFWPYYLKIKLAKLFVSTLDDLHRKVEEFILEQWPHANITGARYEAQEAYIQFVITSGPDRDGIMRVLDGDFLEGDSDVWEALQFTGHKPGSVVEETLVMRFGRLIGRRDYGVNRVGSEVRPRPPQGERVVWDLIPGTMMSVGPAPTAEHLKRQFRHPDATNIHGAFIRYNDVTGVGEVLDIEALENN